MQCMVKITPEIKAVIEKNVSALATVGEDGNPHCIAVAEARVVTDSRILIGDCYMIQTTKNILRNKNVALVVWDNNAGNNACGYELKGTAQYFKEGEWQQKVKEIHKGYPVKGAIVVTVSKIEELK
jgi:predicted pyridoxine 5'-phosphate oxidase superfamily flavin-nucleotide-binding protein